MLQRYAATPIFALLNLLSLTGAVYYNADNPPDYPGHSDVTETTGSSGYGCQVVDNEVILTREYERRGEDDGTLWTGETVFEIRERSIMEDPDYDITCNGTFRMPTLFWLGPYSQGENGKENRLAMGMVTWRTNSTDKTDTWHAYRPCGSDPVDGKSSKKEFELRGSILYNDATAPVDDSTFGLQFIPPPPGGNKTSPSSSTQLFFNGTYNGVKDTEDYLSDSRFSTIYRFPLSGMNCSRDVRDVPAGKSLLTAGFELPNATFVNGSLSPDAISFRLSGRKDGGILYQLDNGTKGGYSTDSNYSISFNGRYDTRNSSQSLLINETSDPIITFSAAVQSHSSFSLLFGALFGLCIQFML